MDIFLFKNRANSDIFYNKKGLMTNVHKQNTVDRNLHAAINYSKFKEFPNNIIYLVFEFLLNSINGFALLKQTNKVVNKAWLLQYAKVGPEQFRSGFREEPVAMSF